MFIKIGRNIINVNDIVRVFKNESCISILIRGYEEPFVAIYSEYEEYINAEFARICSALIPES